MKKPFTVFFPIFLTFLLLFSACTDAGTPTASSTVSAEASSETSTAASSDASSAETSAVSSAASETAAPDVLPDKDELYAQVTQTNTIDNVLSVCERVSQNIVYYDAENGDYSIFVYADNDRMAQEDSEGNVLLMQKDGSCGFDSGMNIAYRHLFVGENVYNEYWNGTRDFILFTGEWDNGETVTDLKAEGSSYILTTETPSEDTEGEYIVDVYTIDIQTLLVQSLTCSLRHADNTSEPVCDCSVEYNAEEYKPSEILLNQTYGTGRIVTVIADPGTENEKTYSVEVLPGISVQIYMDSCYTTLFEDTACTVPHQSEDNNLNASCTYYVSNGK